jgi:hypothetical protein
MSKYTIKRVQKLGGNSLRERVIVKGFNDSEAMHKFLNTGSNALTWSIFKENFKAGTYIQRYDSASKGWEYLNIKDLDPSALNHM